MPRRSILPILVLFLIVSMLPAPNPGAAAGTPLYPDLKTTNPSGLYFDRVTMSDGQSHYVLRFSNTVWNAGEGRLEMQGDPNPSGSNKIYQNVYDARTGGTRVLQRQISADIFYHPSHYHYHFEGFASYLLLQRDAAGVFQPTTKKGTKTGFCIMDVTRIVSNGPTYGQYWECGGTLQGLSVGWGDTYESTLPDQWIDLGTSRLPDGYYAIQSTADPHNKILESGRDDNNVALTYFRVSGGVISTQAAPTTASCGISPASGTSGSSVTITCSEFGARETVNVYWKTTASLPLATTTTEKSGRVVLTLQIPQAANGGYSLIVTGTSSRRQDTVSFSVYSPVVSLSPDEAASGESFRVLGTGFAPSESITIRWNGPTGTVLRTAPTTAAGEVNYIVSVPTSARAGVYPVAVTGATSGATAQATFTVNGNSTITRSSLTLPPTATPTVMPTETPTATVVPAETPTPPVAPSEGPMPTATVEPSTTPTITSEPTATLPPEPPATLAPEPTATTIPTEPIVPADSDLDGLSDEDEAGIYATGSRDPDSDDDGVKDGDEVNIYATNPVNADTDNDGLGDGQEIITYTTDALNPDTDGDGLSDSEEVTTHRTDPTKPDTDSDGVSDAAEVLAGTDPLNAEGSTVQETGRRTLLVGSILVATETANLRVSPSLDADIVLQLSQGTEATVIGPIERAQGRDWIPVTVMTQMGEVDGYIAMEFVDLADPAP